MMQFVWKIQHTHNDNSNYLVWSFLRLWCFDPRPLRFWCAALVAHRAHRSWHNVVRWYGAVNAPKIVKERHIIGAIWVDCLDGTSVLWATTEVSTTLLAPKRQDMVTMQPHTILPLPGLALMPGLAGSWLALPANSSCLPA